MFIAWIQIISPSIITNTLIKTRNDLIPVQNIAINDHLIGYSGDRILTEVIVTNVTTTTINTLILITTKNGTILAVPDQLFYDPLLQAWVTAKNITTSTIFLDSNFNHCSCLNVKTIEIKPITAYQISTTAPYNFFVTDQQLLTHNFFPLITFGVTWLFGLGSVEFTGLSIATILGGTAIGIKLFNTHGKQTPTCTITPQGSSTYGGFNPDPDDDDDNQSTTKRVRNTISKTEFFKSVKNDYEYWRNNTYIRKHRAKGLDKQVEYLKWDHLHNDVEAYDVDGNHLGSYDPKTLRLYKEPNPRNFIETK